MNTGINAIFINSSTFSVAENLTDIFIKGRNIKANCGVDGFKFGTVLSSSFSVSATQINLTDDSDDLTDQLSSIWYEEHPHMEDGRPIIRSDTRPLNTSTYFTMAGDNVGIGDGDELRWDFTNDDNLYTGSEIPSGYKAKEMKIKFSCPVNIKDGTIYFFNAPWGSYLQMDIMVPSGAFYPNPAGPFTAQQLGLSGNKKYAQATEDIVFQRYVSKHFIYGDCPMGDELNAEGAAVDALPIGWYIRGLVVTTELDMTSKGFASLEMYRCHTAKLPGQGDLH